MPNPNVDRLYSDAIVMSMNKNLVDITTLLQWATESHDVGEKIQHVSRAIELLEDVRHNLETLGAASAGNPRAQADAERV